MLGKSRITLNLSRISKQIIGRTTLASRESENTTTHTHRTFIFYSSKTTVMVCCLAGNHLSEDDQLSWRSRMSGSSNVSFSSGDRQAHEAPA